MAELLPDLLGSYFSIRYLVPKRTGQGTRSMNLPWCRAARFHLPRFTQIHVLALLAALGIRSIAVFAQLPQTSRQNRIHTGEATVERTAGPKYHPSRLLVRYKTGTTTATMHAIHEAVSAKVLRELPIVKGLQLVQIEKGSSIQEALRYYRKNANVLYAEPDYFVHALI